MTRHPLTIGLILALVAAFALAWLALYGGDLMWGRG